MLVRIDRVRSRREDGLQCAARADRARRRQAQGRRGRLRTARLIERALPSVVTGLRTARRRPRDPFHEPAESFPFGAVEWIGERVAAFFALLAYQLPI